MYRATLRTQIREWLDSITAKRHQEWLIVHVTSGRGSGGKFYQRKGTIVDKIKADFNVGKRDRSVSVPRVSFCRPLFDCPGHPGLTAPAGLPASPSAVASKLSRALRRRIRHLGPTS